MIAPVIAPSPIPRSEPVGPRCFAPIAPSIPVAPRVVARVTVDFPAS